MKVLSFDVGIKNLSYCILDDKRIIHSWGILNISIDPVCDHHIKDKHQCDKSATYLVNGMSLCSSHKNLKKYKTSSKPKKIPKHKHHLFELGTNLLQILDTHPEFLMVEYVLIENQPALKNPTMKTIQTMIYTYFLIHGIQSQDSPISMVHLINARHKLKAYHGSPISCDIKDKYKKTKFLSIHYCQTMISTPLIHKKFKDLYTLSKKKDDLADAYLQGMYWLDSRK